MIISASIKKIKGLYIWGKNQYPNREFKKKFLALFNSIFKKVNVKYIPENVLQLLLPQEIINWDLIIAFREIFFSMQMKLLYFWNL